MKLLSRCCSALPLCFWASMVLAQDNPNADLEVTPQDLALDRHAVVVLPLRMVTEDPKAPELAIAVHEALIDELRSISGLYVVEGDRVAGYSGSDLSPIEIARVLGAGSVLSGEIATHDALWTVSLSYRNAGGGERPGGASAGSRFKRVGPAESQGLPDLDEVRDRLREFIGHIETSLFPERQPDQAKVVAEMQARILDASLSDEERVEAVEAMPLAVNASPSYVEARSQALSGPPALALAQIATSSDNARLRMRIWSVLSGVDDPNLIVPLLTALENDANGAVRVEAARRLLETFRDAPGVAEALEYVAENDPSEQVRKGIRFETLSDAEQKQALRETILDTNATYGQRLSALRRFDLGDGTFGDLDSEIVRSTVDLAQSTDNPRERYRVWVHLARTEDPYIVEPLIEELETASSDDMKSLAVRGLGRFLDYPGVREALEEVAAQDGSLKIREMASHALDGPDR